MAATAYGIGLQEYEPRPDFSARRDAKGGWSASNSFSMLREVWENYARTHFLKGTKITELYTELSPYWSFLLLDEVEVGSEAGGITIARCQWVGFNEEEEDGDDDTDRERVFSLSGTRSSRAIMEHPLFRMEVLDGDVLDIHQRQAIAGAVDGSWVADPSKVNTSSDYYLKSTTDPSQVVNFTDPDVIKWIRAIVEQGIKTVTVPALQWTVDLTSVAGWEDKDLDHLGLIEFTRQRRPPGDPPMPRFGKWEGLKIAMNQTRTNGKTRQSQTWELVPPGGDHRFLAPNADEGIYNYDPSALGPPE